MSLEVTLIPLAFVIINVIDQEYYDSWIKQKRIKKETNYSSMDEFIRDLNRTSYNYDIQQNTVRIYSKEKGKKFFFSLVQGKWVISFNEYDGKDGILDFLNEIANASNGKVTSTIDLDSNLRRKSIVNNTKVFNMPSFEERETCFFPTIFNDENKLKTVLSKLDIHYVENNGSIDFVKDNIKCSFLKDDNGQIILRTVGNASKEDLFRSLQELDIVYKRDVQKAAYDSVMEKMSEQNMSLAKEVRIEDDTIVLTLNIE